MRMKKRVWFGAGCGIVGVTALAVSTFLFQTNMAEENIFGQFSSVKMENDTKLLSTAVSNKESQGMTVHFQWNSKEEECPHLYYTNVNGSEDTNMTSPGVPMNEDGDGWYSYTIPDADSAEIQISVKEKGYQTTRQKKSGDEWWFTAGEWYAEKPYSATDTTKEEKAGQEVVEDAVTVANDSKVTVHCYSADTKPSLYYWNALPNDLEVGWPGTDMISDGDGWYSYTFDSTTKINVLFVLGDKQTDDFTAKTGEWWYTGSEWTSKDPTEGPHSTVEPTSTPNVVTTPNPDIITTDNDFREETIYFVMTTRFFDGDKTNNVHCADDKIAGNGDDDPAWRGDFKGLIEKLDYIKALGFSAVWITPVVENASGYDFHGYHALDFKRVDPRLESDGVDYQLLIDEAHKRGMKIIQDVVLQHTSNYGEQGLYELFDQEYVLDKGVKGNSVTQKANDISALDAHVQTGCQYAGTQNYGSYDAIPDSQPTAKYQTRNVTLHSNSNYRDLSECSSEAWENFVVTKYQIAGDCQELNTEKPEVYNYVLEAYEQYMKMGVDAFRIDTVKHISRLTMNNAFIPGFSAYAKSIGKKNFFMYGEVCCRVSEVVNHGVSQVSPFYYTWKPEKSYTWNNESVDGKDNLVMAEKEYDDHKGWKPSKSDNAKLDGNNYHDPDYTLSSGLGVIDYAMHFNFESANKAFDIGKQEDDYMNDSTYNVVYVDSHDYGPAINGNDSNRYGQGTEAWAENLDLMFTFRGIPCLYYGSEIEFQKDVKIDAGNSKPLAETGRAYFGDNIEGTVNTTDFGVYNGATGAMAKTLNSTLAKHLQTLNRIRRVVPALQKGQYSTEGCNGNMAYKRRYVDKTNSIDSYVLVAISGGCTFNDVLKGKYVDLVTGQEYDGNSGTITVENIGKANMRVLVYQNPTAEAYGAAGKVGEGSIYLK